MKLRTIKIRTGREDLQSQNAPFETIPTDESIEMPSDDLIMKILHRIIAEGREEGEKETCKVQETL